MNEYSAYRSPIRLLNELGLNVSEINEDTLKMEKKRLFLEIQISKTSTVYFGERLCTKNDVIEIFDEIKSISHLDFHLMIFNSPTLLNFLEYATVEKKIPYNEKIQFNTQEETDKFREFVSPYLANAINKLMTISIEERNFLAVDRIQSYFQFLTPDDALFAFQEFNNFCKTLNDLLEAFVQNQQIFPRGYTYFLHYAPFYSTVNYLEHYYPSLPDIVAEAVINFTERTQFMLGRRKSLVTISNQLSRLNCAEHLTSKIKEKHELFSRSIEEPESEKITPQGVLRVIIFIGLAIYTLTKLFGSEDESAAHHSNKRFDKEMQKLQQDIEKNNRLHPNQRIRANLIKDQFKEFHQKVVSFVEMDSSFVPNQRKKFSKPCITGRFIDFEPGITHNLRNETDSDMLLIVWGSMGLKWFFVKGNETTAFKAEAESQMFFYSGKKWDSTLPIVHRADYLSTITIPGHYSDVSAVDFDFLRKRFSLINGKSTVFTIKDLPSGYKFYQGKKPVSYSY